MTKALVRVVATATIVLALCGSQHAQSPKKLTAQDYLDIQQLVARYAYTMDSGVDNGFAYADLFTADGEFISPTGSIKGREALAEAGRSGFVNGHKPANGVSHFIVNNVVTPSAEGATGKQYVVLVNIGEDGKPGGTFSDVGGHYDDVYLKTAQGWRFKRREFVPMKSERRAPAGGAAQQQRAVSTHAQERSASPVKPLTEQDYVDIRALAARYAYGLDTGAENGTGSVYADVFTDDAEFHGPPAVPGGKPFDAKGREELRKFAIPGRGAAYVRHFMFNHLIDASPEGARGKVYLLVIDVAQNGKATSINMGGHYEDVYVKTPAGWRIKSRNFFRSKSAQTVQKEAVAATDAAAK